MLRASRAEGVSAGSAAVRGLLVFRVMKSAALAFVVAALGAGCVANVDTIDPNDPTVTTPPDDPDPSPISEHALSNAEHTAFNYFVTQGLTEIQSAAIVGNLIQESSVKPTAVQYGGGPGRGIAQWSVGGRWDSSHNDNVTSYATSHGGSRWDLTTQLDFTWYELTTFSGYGLAQLRAATTVSAATVVFQNRFEVCGACNQSNRIASANQVLAAYGGSSGGGSTGGGTGGGTTNTGATCYSGTLGMDMPDNACVESKFDGAWYQCSNGSWVDRWSDPDACNGVHPL